MADSILEIVNAALVFATDLWSSVVESTGMWSYYFAAILGLLLLRYLLSPIFGGRVRFSAGSSDRASRSRGRSDLDDD